ncbi:MAG: hypothetical protein PHH24_04040 [Candidatus Moranbacteria bacterium]|jgi:spoIIIJ-associated protein|nr:hypothetical protein [Candidatus Moranbacteria bacterium]MDD5651804.1 hypothetical protein [Candidatus Moranbacteria bacterium]MDX9856031.1 R3H domain-containing nucleic acid-binding protein [Candidatus Moranbacteria bacterium]
MDKKVKKIIESSTKDMTKSMGFECEVSADEVSGEDGTSIVCNIKTESGSNFLIGQNGDNLQALQHLVRLIVRKKTEERMKFILDVNSYKKEKNESIVHLANDMAKKAIEEGKVVALRPMSAYERRLVHMELSENENISTESIGEGEERKIVIKPLR